MSVVIKKDEVVQCVLKELQILQVTDSQNTHPNIGHLLPEIRYAIVETLLLHTRGNQALAARILGINRGTLRKIYRNKVSM